MASVTPGVQVGDRRSYDGAACTIRYIGAVQGTSGTWLGVEWDDPARGKHDGSHKGQRYFTCTSQSPTAASFVRPTRTAESPRGFLEALVDKYTAEIADSAVIKFSGKVAEEVGFEKTRSKQANLAELRVAILDGERIDSAYGSGPDASKLGDDRISKTCPKVRDLDLSRNLFGRLGPVVDICSELPALRTLRLNGNRFADVLEDDKLLQDRCKDAFRGVEEVAFEETLMTWEELCFVGSRCEKLASLSASTNQLVTLPPLKSAISPSSLASSLVALTLEFNEFTSFADIASLGGLEALRNLHLKGNNIRTLLSSSRTSASGEHEDVSSPHEDEGDENLNPVQYKSRLPVFSKSIQYLDVSYNKIDSWDFVDGLPICFPGLTALRFAHNPIYDNPDPEHSTTTKNLTEEAYMFTVARLPALKALNFGTISKNDRQDAEMFYLGRVGKHLASISVAGNINNNDSAANSLLEEQEASLVRRHHPRYAELCELYGAPAVVRRKDINPAFIEARLITVHFVFSTTATEKQQVEKIVQLPKGLDVYAVKGIVARLFGGLVGVAKPLDLRLVWETGEWDPVADFDQELGDSSEDEDEDNDDDPKTNDVDENAHNEGPQDDKAGDPPSDTALPDPAAGTGRAGGKWVKREVELPDGPRQLGFCVDGQEVKIRVEKRS